MEIKMSRRSFVTVAAAVTAAAAGAVSPALADEAAWDEEYDFVVAGSGTAIWGALAAKVSGLDRVLIVEKRGLLGGTAALCTGCFWLPMNPLMEANGNPDDRAEAIEYITNIAEGQSRTDLIKASKGVLLSTGGFDYNKEWRDAFLRTPLFNTIQVEGNDGAGIRMGLDAGADLANMASNYGCSYWMPFGEEPAENIATDPSLRFDADAQRNYPHSIIVNRTGRRFGDESSSYCIFNRAFEGWHSGTCQVENIPGYWICDSQFTEHYVLPTGREVGEVPEGYVVADTLEELAGILGVDVDGLLDEVATFNRFCETGVDLEWHRGEGRFDTHSHAAEDMPEDLANPSLGTLGQGPYYAFCYYPGTLGTSGGLKINGDGQVINRKGEVIDGLYAAGCTAQGVFGPGYPGPGGPIAAGSVFAYAAGLHAAAK